MNQYVEKLQKHAWVGALVLWGAIILVAGMFRFDTFGLSESAARALLANWSVAEQIANPILVLGAPDFRALLFIPPGVYWPGSMVAVKVFTGILFFISVVSLYRWMEKRVSAEAALLASGLLLISPLVLHTLDSLDAAPYLLLSLTVGLWVDQRYRAQKRQLAGWYFTQIFLTLVAVSLHPAGLAYPLAIAWEWWTNPLDKRQQKQMFWGLGLATLFTLIFRFGWQDLTWLANPLKSSAYVFTAYIADAPTPPSLFFGIVTIVLLTAVLIFAWREVTGTLLGRMLLCGSVVGLIAADITWATLVLVLLLYFGIPLLLKVNDALGSGNFTGQRGLVLGVVFVLATVFMINDKTYRAANQRLALTPQDHLLQTLQLELEGNEDPINISSQWPARTMLATRHPAFPLPPAERGDQLVSDLSSVGFIVFNPYVDDNKAITTAVSEHNQIFETISIEEQGVLIKVRTYKPVTQDQASSQPAVSDQSQE